ncbi:hypothetical protein CXG81DRAFT_24082 [Caulochytrium protostelioides]|uniref:Cilia- and flagella-associated protein 43 n=1 Tax=Caulochytrium protostelioides TaxID=1555241 RepID=A0A4P9XCW2_9FUNG|nr:hypothetical protein CXG81DRAFT_24082 [Caulochytrium protostelioides]|eukprot:RKP03307.1 hypothetical protein CXG81DRAFT_24082 [Caulochytrium protostelioides]
MASPPEPDAAPSPTAADLSSAPVLTSEMDAAAAAVHADGDPDDGHHDAPAAAVSHTAIHEATAPPSDAADAPPPHRSEPSLRDTMSPPTSGRLSAMTSSGRIAPMQKSVSIVDTPQVAEPHRLSTTDSSGGSTDALAQEQAAARAGIQPPAMRPMLGSARSVSHLRGSMGSMRFKSTGDLHAPSPEALAITEQYEAVAAGALPTSTASASLKEPRLASLLALDTRKHANLVPTDVPHQFLTITGSTLVTIDAGAGTRTHFQLPSGKTIGALALHPTFRFIALAETNTDGPLIYVYRYPEMVLFRVLEGGSATGFACLAFSPAPREGSPSGQEHEPGAVLASIGIAPGYLLTLWNWRDQKITLRSKAFSQDVYNFAFAPDDPTQIVTSGVGHIKFWKMSSTFTGLKLQGTLGKFGTSELSDIRAFVFLPDGTILSTSEQGNLLLWDGDSIKCELAATGRKSCHAGAVTGMVLNDHEVTTTGDDGWVRSWDLETILNADTALAAAAAAAPVVNTGGPTTANAAGAGAPGTKPGEPGAPSATAPKVAYLEMLEEMSIDKDTAIRHLVRIPGAVAEYWVQTAGAFLRIDTHKRVVDKLVPCHAGAVTALDVSHALNVLVSGGQDGTLRLYDYAADAALVTQRCSAPVTAMRYLPRQLDAQGRALAVGFEDGFLRIYTHAMPQEGVNGRFVLQYVARPHATAVKHLLMDHAEDSRSTALITSDGQDLFVFSIDLGRQDAASATFNRKTARVYTLGFVRAPGLIRQIAVHPSAGSDMDGLGGMGGGGDGADAMMPPNLTLTMADGARAQTLTWRRAVKRRYGATSMVLTDAFYALAPLDLPPAYDVRHVLFVNGMVSLILLKATTTEAAADGVYQVRSVELRDAYRSALLHAAPATDPLVSIALSADQATLYVVAANDVIHAIRLLRSDLFLDGQSGHESLKAASDRAAEHQRPVRRFMAGSTLSPGPGVHSGLLVRTTATGDATWVAGPDGSIMCYRVPGTPLAGPTLSDAALRAAAETGLDEAVDVTDPNTYTIEVAALQSQKDLQLNEYREKRKAIEEDIARLRHEFQSLQDAYASRGASGRADPLWRVDAGLERDVAQATQQRIQAILDSNAYEQRKAALKPQKFRDAFLNRVAEMAPGVAGCLTALTVTGFRVLKPDFLGNEEARALCEAADAQARGEPGTSLHGGLEAVAGDRSPAATATATATPATATTTATSGAGGGMVASAATTQPPAGRTHDSKTAPSSTAVAVTATTTAFGEPFKLPDTTGMTKGDARKKIRQTYLAYWQQLMRHKPDEATENPQDLALIQHAKRHVGDYILKTSDEYGAADGESMEVENAQKKWMQIPLLQYSIQKLQLALNNELRQLQAMREAMLQRLEAAVIQFNQLGDALRREMPQLSVAVMPPAAEICGKGAAADLDHLRMAPAQGAPGPADARSPGADRPRRIHSWIHRRNQIIDGILNGFTRFDQRLSDINLDKIHLERDLKFAHLRLILLYQEWLLLKDFDASDQKLSASISAKRQERDANDAKLQAYQARLQDGKATLATLAEADRALEVELAHLLEEDPSNSGEILTKIYRKNIKRERARGHAGHGAHDGGADGAAGEGRGDGVASTYASSDPSDSDDDDDSDASSVVSVTPVSDACPPDCPRKLHAGVLALRQRRLDLRERVEIVNKEAEAVRKEYDAFAKKQRIIEAALLNFQKELQALQRQKQLKLNELDVVVPIRPDQVCVFQSTAWPDDFSPTIVFPAKSLTALQNRIEAIGKEKQQVRRQYLELRQNHVRLIRARKEKTSQLQALEKKAVEVQMLKFGHIIDLEQMENAGPDKQADELAAHLDAASKVFYGQMAQLDAELAFVKRELAQALKENTDLTETLASSLVTSRSMRETLRRLPGPQVVEQPGPRPVESADRDHLVQTIEAQAQEMDALRAEIETLLRKPGNEHVRLPHTRDINAKGIVRPAATAAPGSLHAHTHPHAHPADGHDAAAGGIDGHASPTGRVHFEASPASFSAHPRQRPMPPVAAAEPSHRTAADAADADASQAPSPALTTPASVLAPSTATATASRLSLGGSQTSSRARLAAAGPVSAAGRSGAASGAGSAIASGRGTPRTAGSAAASSPASATASPRASQGGLRSAAHLPPIPAGAGAQDPRDASAAGVDHEDGEDGIDHEGEDAAYDRAHTADETADAVGLSTQSGGAEEESAEIPLEAALPEMVHGSDQEQHVPLETDHEHAEPTELVEFTEPTEEIDVSADTGEEELESIEPVEVDESPSP